MISYELISLIILKDFYMKETVLSHLYLQMKKLRFIKLCNILGDRSVVEYMLSKIKDCVQSLEV